MSIDLYRLSVGTFLRQLEHLDHILEKAETICTEGRAEEPVVLEGRLYPNMFNFTRQIQLATDFAKNACAHLADIEAPKFEHMEHSLADLRKRVAKTAEYLRGLPHDAFVGAHNRAITIPQRESTLHMSGDNYLLDYALPNFYFHYTTAYGILRHLGVTVGKRDYIGPL
ncbi:MAG: DUF1993 domain-containing protein [Betaproteobacteria bacterium]|nr:DUF1993 domain-containing protein [Betaproteobacteria bacterium]